MFRLFVSSTFTDFVHERQALQSTTFPRIQAYCQEHGARFQPIDLQWGVSEEAGLDQQTMRLCISEIRRCQSETRRPNFLVLLGSRYGWQPLPAAVPAADFEELLAHMSRAEQRVMLGAYRGKGMGAGLYALDRNAVPPEYCLKPRPSARLGTNKRQREARRWIETESLAREILADAVERAAWTREDPRRQMFEDSATQREVREGAFRRPAPDGAVLAYIREFERHPHPGEEGAPDFIDVDHGQVNKRAAGRLAALKESLRAMLEPTGRFHVYRVHDHHALRALRPKKRTAACIARLCKSIEQELLTIIDEELEHAGKRRAQQIEDVSHKEFAADRSSVFVGREPVLARIARYLQRDQRTPLVIRGIPGCGKTTLLAKAACEALADSHAEIDPVVAIRFVGATPRSTALTTFLRDLCVEVSAAYGDATPIPTDPELARSHLAEHILKLATGLRPLWLFLDALDQLTGETSGRELDWLPMHLPKFTRVVVSIMEHTSGAMNACNVAATARWPRSIVTLGGLTPKQADELIGIWLQGANRTLQYRQLNHVRGRFSKNGLPLYLKLCFDEVRRWRSWESLPRGVSNKPGLKRSVESMINELFHRLAQPHQHGTVLVQRATTYLVASRFGLAEDEIIDLLSEDELVMRDFIRHSPTERAKPEGDRVKRLPWIVWSRLENDLDPYLLRRSTRGAVTTSFYYRQVEEVGVRLYLPEREERRTHRTLSGYFRRRADPEDNASWSGTNERGFDNLPYHLARSGQKSELHRILLDYGWLDAKLRSLGVDSLLEDFGWLALEPAAAKVREALDLSRDALSTKYGNLDAQLLGRLRDSRSSKIDTLLARAEQAQYGWALKPLSRSLTPPNLAAVRILRGHRGEAEHVAVTPDGRTIVSCSYGEIKIWDFNTGALIRTIDREGEGIRAIAITPDGERLLAACFTKKIEIWAIRTGKRLKILRGHRHSVRSIAVSADGALAVSGSSDSTAKTWNLNTGECVATFENHTNIVRGVALSPDGRLAISASNDRTVRIWNARTGEEQRRLPHDDFVFSVAMHADGRHLLTGDGDGTLRLWDIGRDSPLESRSAHEGFVYDLVFVRGRRIVASAGYDHMIRLWDLRNKKQSPRVFAGHAGPVNAIAQAHGGKRLVSASHDSTVRIWNLEAQTESGSEARHLMGIRALAVTPDARHALSAADYSELRIWDLQTRTCLATLQKRMAPITVTPDGRKLLSAGGEGYGQHLVAMDLETRSVVWRKPYFDSGEDAYNWEIHAIAITPDGKRALVGSTAEALTVWDVSSGNRLAKLRGHRGCINAVKIAPGAAVAVTGSNDGTVRMWDLNNGMKRTLLGRIDEIIETIAVSSDGRFIVAAPSHEGPIVAWDTVRRKRLWTVMISRSEELAVPGEISFVSDMAITPDDRNIVIASEDHTLTVRDLRDGSVLASFVGDTAMLSCCVLPDGSQILAGERSGRLHFLRLVEGDARHDGHHG